MRFVLATIGLPKGPSFARAKMPGFRRRFPSPLRLQEREGREQRGPRGAKEFGLSLWGIGTMQ